MKKIWQASAIVFFIHAAYLYSMNENQDLVPLLEQIFPPVITKHLNEKTLQSSTHELIPLSQSKTIRDLSPVLLQKYCNQAAEFHDPQLYPEEWLFISTNILKKGSADQIGMFIDKKFLDISIYHINSLKEFSPCPCFALDGNKLRCSDQSNDHLSFNTYMETILTFLLQPSERQLPEHLKDIILPHAIQHAGKKCCHHYYTLNEFTKIVSDLKISIEDNPLIWQAYASLVSSNAWRKDQSPVRTKIIKTFDTSRAWQSALTIMRQIKTEPNPELKNRSLQDFIDRAYVILSVAPIKSLDLQQETANAINDLLIDIDTQKVSAISKHLSFYTSFNRNPSRIFRPSYWSTMIKNYKHSDLH